MDVKLLLLLACALWPESLIFPYFFFFFTLNPMVTKLLKEPSPHKLILFVRGKQLCSLRRTWTKICSFVRFIVFGSILVPSLLCLPSALKTRGFSSFFFCCLSSVGLYAALQPFGHLWFLPKTGFNQLVLRIEHLLRLSSFLSLSDFLQCPSPVLPPSLSALIFFWIAFDFPFTVEPTTRGIAVMARTRKLQRWRCGLAPASCSAVYTEHLTVYSLGGCLCFVIPRFIITQSSKSCWGCWFC